MISFSNIIKVALVFFIILSLYLLVDRYYLSGRVSVQDTEFKKVSDYVGVSANRVLSEDEVVEKAKQLIRDKDPRLYKDIEQLNDATYLIRSKARHSNSADYTYVKDGKNKYLFYEIYMPEQGGIKGPALGCVMIFSDGRVVSKVYNNDIKVTTLIKEDKSVVTSADLYMKQAGLSNRKDSKLHNWVNEPYRLNISDSVNYINLENFEKDKIVFDFILDLGLNGHMVLKDFEFDFAPTLGFSVLNWGNDKRLKYRFLRFGVGAKDLDNGVFYSLSPIMFNLNSISGIFHNTYIGPSVGYDNRGVNFGALLALTF